MSFPVLFLDMDGVLNSATYLRGHRRISARLTPNTEDMSDDERWADTIDPIAVDRLNRILKTTNARAVLSSSWRYRFSEVEPLSRIMKMRGFAGELIDRTPLRGEVDKKLPSDRGYEVATWLKRYPEVDRFVILDDSNDFPNLRHRLVRTSWEHGLLEPHIAKAIELLNTPEKRS